MDKEKDNVISFNQAIVKRKIKEKMKPAFYDETGIDLFPGLEDGATLPPPTQKQIEEWNENDFNFVEQIAINLNQLIKRSEDLGCFTYSNTKIKT